MISAAILPLHDPIRIAEQIAVLDNAFPGRTWVVFGAGYRVEEFEMAGLEHAARGRVLEEHVGAVLEALTGEPFEWRGREVRGHAQAGHRSAPDVVRRRRRSRRGAPRRRGCGLSMFPMNADAVVREAYFDEAQEDRVRGRFRAAAGRSHVRARGRRSREGVGRDRQVRALRGADLRVVPDAGPALDARRARRVRRRPEGVAAIRRRYARRGLRRGCRRFPTEGGIVFNPLAGRSAARPWLVEPGAVRGEGAAAAAPGAVGYRL